MMRKFTTSFALLGCLASAGIASGAVIAQYEFEASTGVNSGDSVTGLTGVTVFSAGLGQQGNASVYSKSSDLNSGFSTTGDNSTGSQTGGARSYYVRASGADGTTLAQAIAGGNVAANYPLVTNAGDDYATFSFTIAPGYKLNVSSLTFSAARNATSGGSPNTISVLSSVGGFTSGASLGDSTLTTGLNGDGNFQDFTVAGVTGSGFDALAAGTYEFRLYVYNGVVGLSSNDPSRIDNIVLSGDITVIPEPASLALLALGGVALMGKRRRA